MRLTSVALLAAACAAPTRLAYQATAPVRAYGNPEPVLAAHDHEIIGVLKARGYDVRVLPVPGRLFRPRIAGGSGVIATRADAGGRDSLVVTLRYSRTREDRDVVDPFGSANLGGGFVYAIAVVSFDERGTPRPASPSARADADSVAAAVRTAR
jgi:hypothetical protein